MIIYSEDFAPTGVTGLTERAEKAISITRTLLVHHGDSIERDS